MPLDWIGITTKVFSSIGQRIFKRWLFEAEVVEGKYVVYISNRGDSPYVDVWLSLRVHNRNNSPTTLYAERMTVKPNPGVEDSFPRPGIRHFGEFRPSASEHNRIEIGGSSTLEITFDSRKYFRELPKGYLEELPLDITVRVAETYGNHRELTGRVECVQILKQ